MVMIKVTKPFKFAIDGVRVVNYDKGEHEVNKECAEVACKEGWAKMMKPAKSGKDKKE